MRPSRIPLFALEVVLFPLAPLPLHIFEPRYRRMVKRCLDTQTEFGVILARSEGIARIGCTAEITGISKQYEDGRMDILTVGRIPFRIEEVHTDDPLLEGDVEYLQDDPAAPTAAAQAKLLTLYERCSALVSRQASAPLQLEQVPWVSYHIAQHLPLDLPAKQRLLEIRSEGERQELLLRLLEDWLPQLERAGALRKRAGGNGDGLSS